MVSLLVHNLSIQPLIALAEHIFTAMPYKKKGERERERDKLREKEIQPLLSLELIVEKRYPEPYPHSFDISITQSTTNVG